jgi:hypothetical protein
MIAEQVKVLGMTLPIPILNGMNQENITILERSTGMNFGT